MRAHSPQCRHAAGSAAGSLLQDPCLLVSAYCWHASVPDPRLTQSCCNAHQAPWSPAGCLGQVVQEPSFNVLRTKQQLGYSVASSLRLTHGLLGFSFHIVSGAMAVWMSPHTFSSWLDVCAHFQQLATCVCSSVPDAPCPSSGTQRTLDLAAGNQPGWPLSAEPPGPRPPTSNKPRLCLEPHNCTLTPTAAGRVTRTSIPR